MSEEFMAELANRAERLADLMRSPQPGLGSWASLVRDNANFISDWWTGKMTKWPEDAE